MAKMTISLVMDADQLFFKSRLFNRIRNYEEAVPWFRQLVAHLSP
jgi:hypothetical protein